MLTLFDRALSNFYLYFDRDYSLQELVTMMMDEVDELALSLKEEHPDEPAQEATQILGIALRIYYEVVSLDLGGTHTKTRDKMFHTALKYGQDSRFTPLWSIDVDLMVRIGIFILFFVVVFLVMLQLGTRCG